MIERRHDVALRDPEQVISLSATAQPFDPDAVKAVADDGFVRVLDELGITLLVTREYEHLVLALSAVGGRIVTSSLRVPHPAGLVVDRDSGSVYVACTRNPNQLLELRPSAGWFARQDRFVDDDPGAQGLVPHRMRFLAGCMYLHDLAIVEGRLLANAVGLNAIVDLTGDSCRAVWWPRSADHAGRLVGARNLIQLNSIAAGPSLEDSCFTASCESYNGFVPGDPAWPIDRQGVIFDGRTREVIASGLTRPHSARRGVDGSVFVDDSGYGTLNVVSGDSTKVVAALPGWTRGLCIVGGRAFVGTSRVIPRFEAYAPGLDPAKATCGLHVVDLRTGVVEGSLTWPTGDQVFAIDWIESTAARGFVGGSGSRESPVDSAWYKFRPEGDEIADTMFTEGWK